MGNVGKGSNLDHGGATLEEIGEVLGCTRERVRQIEKQALENLRNYCARNGLNLDDFIDEWTS